MSEVREMRIIGGGLSSLSLGVALSARGVPVSVLEKGRYPRHRVCGEFICGVSDEVLDSLGIADLFASATHLQSMVWWHEDKVILSESLTLPARGISRFRLDQLLAGRLSSLGGGIHSRKRCELSEVGTEGVVWTAGRPRTKEGRWIGLKCHVRHFELQADLEMHLGTGGYAGLSRIEDGKANLCGLFEIDSSIKARMPDLLIAYLKRAGANELVKRIRSAEVDADSCCSVAGFSMGEQSNPGGVLCAGDASRMIPPFTGNGMSMAFESADLLASELIPWSRGEVTWMEVRRCAEEKMTRHFKKRMHLAQALHIPLMHPMWQKVTSAITPKGLLPTDWLFRHLRAS